MSWISAAFQTEETPLARLLWHTATSYGENVIIFGGSIGDTKIQKKKLSNDLYWIESSSFNFQKLKCKGNSPPNRCQHIAFLLGKDYYVYGGYNGTTLSDFYTINIDELEWRQVKVPKSNKDKQPKLAAPAIATCEKKIYMHGGKEKDKIFSKNLYTFEKENQCWIPVDVKGDIPEARAFHTLTYVHETGEMYLFGGLTNNESDSSSDLFKFTLTTNTWEKIKPIGSWPPACHSHCAIYTHGGIVLLGGLVKGDNVNDIWFFDIGIKKWKKLLPKNSLANRQEFPGRARHTANLVGESKIYVIGGASPKESPNEVIIIYHLAALINSPGVKREFQKKNEGVRKDNRIAKITPQPKEKSKGRSGSRPDLKKIKSCWTSYKYKA
eukprot:TRINITY_DN3550_c0_g1_i4.p1 TRINITY_DN3550_c0_g1~~TRINITY_DN3550_c0_g1_i4.p1  ORF type:complete len:382 (+),score=54.93 TRINITY_DN3550_c0_g1_i4:70-1215(+)